MKIRVTFKDGSEVSGKLYSITDYIVSFDAEKGITETELTELVGQECNVSRSIASKESDWFVVVPRRKVQEFQITAEE